MRVPQLVIATATIALSWAVVHTAFALHYAHDYYRGSKPGGLQFPSGDKQDHADYWDFVYFSFVIGMTAQVSDVGITDKTIRRTATVHGIISFVFNTALAGADGQHRGERDFELSVIASDALHEHPEPLSCSSGLRSPLPPSPMTEMATGTRPT